MSEKDRCGRCAAPANAADDCRHELVTAIHSLASEYENALCRLVDAEAIRKAEGDIAYARSVAARWNANGGIFAAPAEPLNARLLEVMRNARWRIANLSRAAVPLEDPLDGPVLRELDTAIAAADAAQPVALTEEQLSSMCDHYCPQSEDEGVGYRDGWRAAERHFGIQAAKGEPTRGKKMSADKLFEHVVKMGQAAKGGDRG